MSERVLHFFSNFAQLLLTFSTNFIQKLKPHLMKIPVWNVRTYIGRMY